MLRACPSSARRAARSSTQETDWNGTYFAVCVVNPELAERYLHELDDRHFDNPLHRRLRAYLVGEQEADDELLSLRAELDAIAAAEGLNEETGTQLFLRLEERLVRRQLSELEGGDLERTVELQGVLAKIREALREGVPT